jgi:hypothetical protein
MHNTTARNNTKKDETEELRAKGIIWSNNLHPRALLSIFIN